MQSPTHSADLALAVYLEPLARGRRVLWIGTAARGAERLEPLARSIRVQTPDSSSAGPRLKPEERSEEERSTAEPARLRVGRLRPGPIRFRPGSFDLVVVPDASVIAVDPDRIDQLAAVLSEEGVLAVGQSSDGPLSYADLHTLVRDGFAQVRMLGQAPFAAWAVVDFEAVADGPPDVVIDGSAVLADEDTPSRFVAVCGHVGVDLDPYLVVRVPASPPDGEADPSGKKSDRGSDGLFEHARINELEERLRAHETELDLATEHAESIERRLAERSTEIERLKDALDATQAELDRARTDAPRTPPIDPRPSDPRASDPRRVNGAGANEVADAQAEREYQRLEAALGEQGHALREAQAELERRAVLVRDLVEELREVGFGASGSLRLDAGPGSMAARASVDTATGGPTNGTSPNSTSSNSGPTNGGPSNIDIASAATIPPARRELRAPDEPSRASERGLAAAIERAVAAEAARAAAQFECDELRGRLLATESERAEFRRREAELVGRARGLSARIAELGELGELAQGQLSLTQFDLDAARKRNRELQRDLGDVREQFELELSRAHVTAAATRGQDDSRLVETEASERRLSERVSELSGQLMACRDLVGSLEEERDNARTEALRLTARVAQLEDRFSGARRGYEHRIAELGLLMTESSSAANSQTETPAATSAPSDQAIEASPPYLALRGELEGVRARVRDREAALVALRAVGAQRPQSPGAHEADSEGRAAALAEAREREARAQAEADRLSAENASIREELDRRQAEVEQLEIRLSGEGEQQAALERARAEIDRLRRDAEMALRSTDTLREAQDELDRLRDEVADLRSKDSSQAVRLADAEELLELEASRALDLASTLAARDALIARLQMDLADAEQSGKDGSQRVGRLREENDRLREALIHASQRVDQVEALERQLNEASERADRSAGDVERSSSDAATMREELARLKDETERARGVSDASREGMRRALREVRASLEALSSTLGVQPASVSAGITAVGMESPEWTDGPPPSPKELDVLRERVASLEHEISDRDTLLRSATAQLEERDDRLRALERELGVEPGGSGDPEALRRELMQLEERSARLAEELDVERRARRAAEAAVLPGVDLEELERARESLRERDSDLAKAQRSLTSREREVKGLRDAASQARAGLEELLGVVSMGGDPATAERLGALLRLLGRA
jgi:chromosome segregation ATPase